jgi:large subunit ribosomal protein L4e
MTSAARPLVSVHNATGVENFAAKTIAQPDVFTAPIRPDVVHFVHSNMAKNSRQAYSVKVHFGPSGIVAGHQHSAISWGTGRAVSRIPRVKGGGTHRAGQAAFGNMCRSGRMFAPTKTFRKWHRKINTNQRRYAVVSALAASSIAGVVMSRGHKIDQVPEVPLVVNNELESIQKTKEAVKALQAVGAYADVERCIASKKLRAGKGKMRNRRHVLRRGPLIVYNEDNGIVRAFRNLPGVELAQVSRLNLLQLAPGAHLGRFIIWTESAFRQLNSVFGGHRAMSQQKKGYKLPKNVMTNTDLARIINSDEIQSKVRAPIKNVRTFRRKKNALKNFGVMVKLNPYALALRRNELKAQEVRAQKRAAVLASKRS